jgi:hypothetical protein
MPRHIRSNPARDENQPPSASDCLAHRCDEHREMKPVDDSADDGAECGICVAAKFVLAHEEAAEKEILDRLFWPMVETARDRLNLLALGAGASFEEQARVHVVEFSKIFGAPSPAIPPAETPTEESDGNRTTDPPRRPQ